MFRWLTRLRAKPAAPLAGAPPVRRQKTYSGQSGYVYQYYYEGYRPAERENRAGTEFVFDVSADRKTSFPVSVFVSDQAVAQWEREHRSLNSTERYAIAKMALFQAFDERENPAEMRREVRVPETDVGTLLATLNLD